MNKHSMKCRNTQVTYEIVFLFEMVKMIMFSAKERLNLNSERNTW